MPATPVAEPTSLRSDAARNRAALIDAGRRCFSAHGLDAPLDEIARSAGVGNATLYRHFPTRCELVTAVFAEALGEVVAAAERAGADPDPWSGFTTHLRFLCRLQARDRGLADLLTAAAPSAPDLEDLRRRAFGSFARLVERAKGDGSLRPDFEPDELLLLLMANAGLVHRAAGDAEAASERLAGYVIDGLRGAAGPCAAAPRRADH